MGREVERKFLLKGDGWREGASGTVYRQGYLANERTRTVRIRIEGDRAALTIKGSAQGARRAEYEYQVPVKDAEELLALCDGPLVEKTRYKIEHAGHIWEVDVFHGENEGLIVAEVELEDEHAEVELPAWIGEEVTDDPRYLNANLAKCPYRKWGSDATSCERPPG